MFTRQIFEIFGIAIIALGIMLMTLAYSPIALLTGIGVFIAGLFLIYRHYVDLGAEANALD